MTVLRSSAARCTLVLLASTLLAQVANAAPRMVLGEYFTREGCSYCAYGGPAQGQMLDTYPSTYTVIEYHWSGGDPHATTFGNNRATFYAVTGTPTAWFDGALTEVGAGSIASAFSAYQSRYNSRKNVATDVKIELGGNLISGNTYRFQARVCIEAGGSAKNMRIFIAQVIDRWPTSPSYSRNTFKQAAATQDITLAAGTCQTITRDLTLDADSVANINNVKIIAWAQTVASAAPASVFQAAVMGYPFRSLDCNNNSIPDSDDLSHCDGSPWCSDCNSNGVPDECDIATCAGDPSCSDCNSNGIPDSCDIASGVATDCNLNGIPDGCDLANCNGSPWCTDCNENGILDTCDIAAGAADCNTNGIPDSCDLARCDGSAWCSDCNTNGLLDVCDVQGVPYRASTPNLTPVDLLHVHQYTFVLPPPAISDVQLAFVGLGDFNFYSEDIVVSLNGVELGHVFQIGMDCTEITDALTLSAASYNAALAGGDAVYTFVPSAAVTANQCANSRVRLTVTYQAAPTSLDANADGRPDECTSGPQGCSGDANCDGSIDWRDIDYLVAGMNDNQDAWRNLFAPAEPPCAFASLDASGDGAVDWRDIDPFVAIMNTVCP